MVSISSRSGKAYWAHLGRLAFGVVMIVSGFIGFFFILFKPNELQGPHPVPLAVAVAAIATISITLQDGADIVGTVLKARRENIPLRKFRFRIIRKVVMTLLLWVFFGPVFTPMPNLIYLIP